MGDLYYGMNASPIQVPDRLLAHLKVVIATKLRRGESFTLTWQHAADEPAGRSTIWMQPAIPMRFVFGSPEPETLNADVVRDLAAAANSASGLTVSLTDRIPDAGPEDGLVGRSQSGALR
ncbi:hypothetical protein NQ166_12550 [Microbacterium sp. zg.Y1090]|uniref:DUF7882 family protein n=1 Tax=Microbacterium TaxID=33882 RepID=UPI00214C963A|nr:MULTISPECIES: hypothetical protein [unclassified Microbacterium]MCR2813831.1 hypothetical protein [Microbacterium sp. zg.Y1084]MCR2819655.1 hypothetical protein [Microbacterium sp. zg.Y1090]MDL5487503.1 hypothetical protein [Microbacterium sp. zg-Y1211]WIM28100.1 hypothetical protein QNO26_13280 [Microbacterium sp. zg-Y1090]